MCRVEDAAGWVVGGADVRRRARKQHVCDECRRTILSGEPYSVVEGRHGGMDSWVTYKACQHCIAARAWLQEACNGYILSEVREELIEHWDEDESFRTPMLDHLIEGMRQRWGDGAMPVPDAEAVRASVSESIA